jgi:hypothetical protein
LRQTSSLEPAYQRIDPDSDSTLHSGRLTIEPSHDLGIRGFHLELEQAVASPLGLDDGLVARRWRLDATLRDFMYGLVLMLLPSGFATSDNSYP